MLRQLVLHRHEKKKKKNQQQPELKRMKMHKQQHKQSELKKINHLKLISSSRLGMEFKKEENLAEWYGQVS
jgi:hypothetical protein